MFHKNQFTSNIEPYLFFKLLCFIFHNLLSLLFCSVKNGVFRQYVSGRAEKELIAFVDDKKWKDVEPVSKWTAPDSIQLVF